MGNKNGNVTRHYLTAQWRFMTQEQLEALPKTENEAIESDSLYYYPSKKCGDHMAIRSKTSNNCLVCRDQKRALSKKVSQVERDIPKRKKKVKKGNERVISVFGISKTVYS